MLWSLDIYVCLSLICSSRVYCIIYLQIHSNCITAYICPSSWLLLIHATAHGASCRATLSLYMKCLNGRTTGTWCVVCMPRTKLPDVLFQCAISIFMYTTSMVWLDYV